ncbi:hypothetical protein D3C81_705450 [compost metagenome]
MQTVKTLQHKQKQIVRSKFLTHWVIRQVGALRIVLVMPLVLLIKPIYMVKSLLLLS